MSAIGPGDVVVCVDVAPNAEWARYLNDPNYVKKRLVLGRAYSVRWACMSDDNDGTPEVLMLDVGAPGPGQSGMWPHRRFRKITSDPALAEITRQIRNCRPVREKEPTNG